MSSAQENQNQDNLYPCEGCNQNLSISSFTTYMTRKGLRTLSKRKTCTKAIKKPRRTTPASEPKKNALLELPADKQKQLFVAIMDRRNKVTELAASYNIPYVTLNQLIKDGWFVPPPIEAYTPPTMDEKKD